MPQATTGALAARGAIHVVLSMGAAAVVVALEPMTAAAVLALATLVALLVELSRRVSETVARAFHRRLGGMLKEREGQRLTGATTLSVGFTVTALLFPGLPAMAGILFAGVGDPVAGSVGRRWGRVRFPGGKSPAGSAAFLGVAFGAGLILGITPVSAILAALLATAIEALALPVDDNLYLPLGSAAAVALVGWGMPL